jgi:hypothetical protein
LNQDFEIIKNQLDSIVEDYLKAWLYRLIDGITKLMPAGLIWKLLMKSKPQKEVLREV